MPDRYNATALDRKDSIHGDLRAPKMLVPGRYQVVGQAAASTFEPREIEIVSGKTVRVTFEAAAMGWLVVNYAPSVNYSREPDRAFIQPLDGQIYSGGILRPGVPRLAAPGRYRVKGRSSAGDIDPVEVTFIEGERTTVTLRLRGE